MLVAAADVVVAGVVAHDVIVVVVAVADQGWPPPHFVTSPKITESLKILFSR